MTTATSSTLPLFWHLSSASKAERIDASVKLVSALQQFQESFVSEAGGEEEEDEDTEEVDYDTWSARLESGNAVDVSYAIRRLIRGLASPRENSRLGFAVVLTELLSTLDTVTCQQILALLKNASQTSGSMSGQEERDMLFARLFGLKSIVQSGLLFRQKPLRASSASPSSLEAFKSFLTELLSLGDKKSWLRETCWWTLASVVDTLQSSDVSWKEDAEDHLLERIFITEKSWDSEKVALALKLQLLNPSRDWKTYYSSYFKGQDVLSTVNLPLLGRLLKDSGFENTIEGEGPKSSAGQWKPRLHFVWDVILDILLSPEVSTTSSGKFQDFYRIVVDENLFAASSSPERKYWGFQVFQKALHRLPASKLPQLFTKNFMRSWINHLSKTDRYLHKFARQLASDVQQVVEKDPKAGFTLVLQLLGTNGSRNFDRITKTKTVETILANMDSNGIKEYIDYLLKQINESEDKDSFSSAGSRRVWIIDQLAILLRKGSVPKDDTTVEMALIWLTTNAFFVVTKMSSKSSNSALNTIPDPPFTDEEQNLCRAKLLACLSDITSLPVASDKSGGTKALKISGVAADGDYWMTKVLKATAELDNDSKHVHAVREATEEEKHTRDDALKVAGKLKAISKENEAARGAEILVVGLLLKCLCDDQDDADWESLRDCITATKSLFFPSNDAKKKKKAKKEDESDAPPVDLIVDVIIGLLEHSNSFSRMIANLSFSMITPLMTEATADLIITQLERRDPTEAVDDEDMEVDINNEAEDETDEESIEGDESGDDDDDDDEGDANEEDTDALRRALEAAVMEDGYIANDGEDTSDEASMDDEQMMAIDDKLAVVFRTRVEERKKGKDAGAQREATYFKNRVLDLVDTFLKKQSSSPLALRFIPPMVELVSTASSDEKQLSDKAKGILRSRLSKPRDSPPVADVAGPIELLESLHQRACKAHSSEVVSVLSLCSIFITRSLLGTDENAVIRIYGDSISDFIKRKASSLNPSFILDFIRKYPSQAWKVRTVVIDAIKEAANGFRQAQALSFVQAVVTGLPHPETKKDEILAFLSVVSSTLLEVVTEASSSERPLMTAAQLKDALKVGVQLCRFSKRVEDNTEVLVNVWSPQKWDALGEKLQPSHIVSSEFKATGGGRKAIKQMAHKRKAEDNEGEGEDGGLSVKAKVKRKKVKRSKA